MKDTNAHSDSLGQNGCSASTNLNGSSFNGFAHDPSGPQASTSKASDATQDHTLHLAPDLALDRNEFVKLALQTLRSAGYRRTAATLAAESGVGAEPESISDFRDAVLQGDWPNAVGLFKQIHPDYHTQESRIQFLVARQKYLELLESKQTRRALAVLRSDIAPHCPDPDQLHKLSSLMMCTDPEDLRTRAAWPGVRRGARQALLQDLQSFLPANVMLPENRMATLLSQARQLQESHCLYHATASPYTSTSSSASSVFHLLADHVCSKSSFPAANIHVLRQHTDEIWGVAFSHNGRLLATSGKDGQIVLWDVENDFAVVGTLSGHHDGITCLAWSPDDTLLVTGSDSVVDIWDVKDRTLVKTLSEHQHEVTAVAWAPDGSGFVTAGMDSKFFFRDVGGNITSTWKTGPYRIMDAAISPDGLKMVAVGRAEVVSTTGSATVPRTLSNSSASSSSETSYRNVPPTRSEWRLQTYDLVARKQISSVIMSRESTCVTLSSDSRFAIVNAAPDEIRLYSIEDGRLLRRFAGHKQSTQLIRNCFGGLQQSVILTGSEDGAVYVWNRETGQLIVTLEGHEHGTVNAVAWTVSAQGVPLIASVGDDSTVRIWAPPQED